ncbi:MAG TPA: hypothetical protein VHL11_21675 [Phototrophicaceae bacterium]|nr:hypothetical protein [Phototrophicaceae bacterium]
MTTADIQDAPSHWQERITGEWHGRPSIFDAQGNHRGYTKVYRSSVFEDGKTTYYMNTQFEATGDLQSRLQYGDFAFGVIDSDQDRIYMGPDFYGTGRPFGALVDAHYYSPGWKADLKTMVHILPGGDVQCYSSLLYNGPAIFAVFNGLYQVAFDYHTNLDTQKQIEAYVQQEIVNGPKQHTLPAKVSGCWTGDMIVYDGRQQEIGVNQVEIMHTPTSLLRADQKVRISGIINREYQFARYRENNLHTYDGPDIYGNAFGYGRALYTSQHFHGAAERIKGREFFIDNDGSMSVVWQFYKSDALQYTTFGVLRWEES